MRVLAVIPARSKSSMKDKNLRLVGGKPLLAHAIKACLACPDLEDTIVSTDSERYAAVARKYGAKIPFLRPAELAEDVPSEDVAKHALLEYERITKTSPDKAFDVVCTVQCTSPLIKPSDISKCVKTLENNAYDSSMTVCGVSGAEHPWWTFSMKEDGILIPFMNVATKGEWGVRQNLPELYRPNGMCYCTRRSTLLEGGRIIGEKCAGVVVPKIRSIDIDDEEDLMIANAIVEAGLVE